MKTKKINGYNFIEHKPHFFSENEMLERSRNFMKFMDSRRTVREISNKTVPLEIIKNIVITASTAPSGANKQPWTFCIVSSKEMKSQIRHAAEKEEYESYNGRMTDEWLKDLAPLGTDWQKPFLEESPYLIIVFKRIFEEEDGKKKNNYYVSESVGIACGFLIAAIHNAGLVTLTHTPSPMNFLTKLLNRPENERPYLLLPVGLPKEEVFVPDISRKKFEEISKIY
jgi:iodotyrosine deiodinase